VKAPAIDEKGDRTKSRTQDMVCGFFNLGKISDHQQSWRYEAGPSKAPGLCSAGGR
jgi:hypothetical protein